MTGTAISRCLSDTDKALRTETPQGLFLFMCAGGSSAPISPLAGFATGKAVTFMGHLFFSVLDTCHFYKNKLPSVVNQEDIRGNKQKE